MIFKKQSIFDRYILKTNKFLNQLNLSLPLNSLIMKKLLLLITSLVILPVLLHAQWSTNPAVNNVICNITGDQAIPKVATCQNGDTYIAYFSSESGNYDIRLQRLDVLGNKLWAPNGILISNNPSMSWLTDWDITADNPAGYCILAVMDIRNGNNNIYGYRIAPDGSFAWGPNGVTLSNNLSFNASPKVIATASGNAVFAWQADSVILMQKISPTGTFLWGPSGKTWAPSGASATHSYNWPQLLPVGTDEFLMKYFEDSGSGMYPTRYIWVDKFNASGLGAWSAPVSVSNAGGMASFNQLVSFINDNSDGCFVSWYDDRDNDQKSNAWVQHVSAAGSVTLGTNGTEVCNNNANNHFYPTAVIPAGSSDVYVFWNEMNSLQTTFGIYGQRITSTGLLLWATAGNPIIPVSSTDVYPLEAKPYQTDMVVFYDQYIDAVNQYLKAMRITPAGTFAWTGNSVLISSVLSQKVHEYVTDLNNEQWILAWEDNRTSGDVDIYAQNLKPAGDLGPVGPLTYGNIDGHVTISGGTASVTSVTVTAGVNTTHPDATGHYAFTNILTGTYTVNATLPGYTSGSQTGVVVLDSQTTPNINFSLNYIPVTGFITGTVTLNGGSGNVSQVVVTAGSNTTNPAANGSYSLEVPGGNYTVVATLSGYSPGAVGGIIVVNGQTTPNVNLSLNPTGSILGQVSLNGGSGNVTQTIITAGTYYTHPDATGFYGMDVPVGTYTVTASLSGYEPGTVNNVVVTGGQTTPNVNFTLNPILTSGTIEGTVTIDPVGYSVTNVVVSAGNYLTNPDANGHYSLIVSAGTYTVEAAYPGEFIPDTTYTNVVVAVSQTIPNRNFHMIWTLGIPGNQSQSSLTIIPNPTGINGKITIPVSSAGQYILELFDQSGRNIANATRYFGTGTAVLPVMDFASVLRSDGVYILRISGKGKELTARFVFRK